MQTLKIGILSDPHRETDFSRRLIDDLKERGARYLIHAGDFQIPENLEILADAGLPYVSVFGNNDMALAPMMRSHAIYKEPHYFMIENLRFKLMHLPYYLSPDEADIIVYGHTHQVKFQYNENILVLNPGEVCARETGRHEALLLEVTPERYTLTRLFYEAGRPALNEHVTEFDR